ncbi:MAG: efflux RND transporter periplasmic adaptor subunit [Polyangiales bacterium]
MSTEEPPPEGERAPAPGEHDPELGFALPRPAAITKSRATLFGAAVLLLCAGGFLAGYVPRRGQQSALAEQVRTRSETAPSVEVLRPERVDDDAEITLPASLQPLSATVIYARAQGYVKAWKVDLGDRVQAGQVLAEIETPELDQQLDQARAELQQAEAKRLQARANRDLANTSLARYKALRPAGVTSQQELDQRSAQALVDEANVAAAEAAVAVQRANLRRLAQLKAFAAVTAPFAGLITVRNIDVGALVAAGNGTPLFSIAATDPVRVLADVPQDVATSVRVDMKAGVRVREYPGRRFEGQVSRVAGALDPSTRTMRTEVRVANPEHLLLTGMYADVSLPLARAHAVFELPATSLITDQNGVRVAVVEGDQLHLRKVVIDRDLGATVHVASGLRGDEQVVRLGSGTLVDGQRVRAREE